MKTKSIFKTFMVYFVLGASPVFVFYEFGLHSMLNNRLQARFDQEILAKAQMLVTLTKVNNGQIDLDFADEFSPEFSRADNPEYFEIWYPDGRVLERSISLGAGNLKKQIDPPENPSFFDIQLASGGKCRVVQASFIPQDELNDIEGYYSTGNGAFVICLAKNREAFDLFIKQIQLVIAASFLAFMALLFFALRMAIRKGLEPLNEVRHQVANLDHNNLDSTIGLKQNILELDPIVDQLNAMLRMIDEAMKREKAFTSNVSHELRTPISELKCIAEVGLKTLGPTDQSREYLQEVLDISNEMTDVVGVLLDLSRCYSHSIPVAKEDLNLLAILVKCVGRVENVFPDKEIELKTKDIKDAWMESDPVKLEQILFNVVQNSASHSPESSQISIDFEMKTSVYCLRVTNPSVNLTDEDLPLIFNRFWQKDSARTGGGSVGLGLSLVKAFSDLLGITIDTKITNENLFALTMEIPVRMKTGR